VAVKPLAFHARARESIRGFPHDVRDRLGKALFLLQMDERPGMPLIRPMPSVARGVSEIRIRGEDGQYRVFYFAATLDGILILHAFRKSTQKTPHAEIELAHRRLKEMLNE
jgi:phage-related protein